MPTAPRQIAWVAILNAFLLHACQSAPNLDHPQARPQFARIGGPPPQPPRPPPPSGPIDPPPSELTELSSSPIVVRLQFRCGGNAVRHEVWRRLSTETTFSKIGWEPSCSDAFGVIWDYSIQPEAVYCYRVRAVNATNDAWSNTVCATTPMPASVPRAPSAWVESTGPTSIRVIYRDNSTDENTFWVRRRRLGDPAWTTVHTLARGMAHKGRGEVLTYNDTGLTTNTAYQYVIEAGYDPITPGLPSTAASQGIVTGWTLSNAPVSIVGSCTSATGCTATFPLDNQMQLLYYRNYPLSASKSSITRLIVVIHGASRNAGGYFTTVASSATTGGFLGNTLIVAPLFGYGQWGDGWREGSYSFPGVIGGFVTSFGAMDALIMAATNPSKFPNLREVVVTGHSAGGQFTQRYAATTTVVASRPTINFRFVVANPSSYMYLNHRRPSFTGYFVIPSEPCAGYDEYKYGMRHRYGYAALRTDAQIRIWYQTRYVIYLLGEDDNDPNADQLDESCEANVQGPDRLSRGRSYYLHMLNYFPGNRHRSVIVPDVGHTSSIWQSAEGMRALFL